MSFKSDERRHQLRWKRETQSLSDRARRPGRYSGASAGAPNEHFLHEDHCFENLMPAIREEALDLFDSLDVDWHDGPKGKLPSNYLMDSQVSCVNALLPFAHHGDALAEFLRPLVPGATGAEAVEDGRLLTFEWNGLNNPLGERSPKRKRGAYGTSLDAYAKLTTATERVGVAIEWKYTEQYLRAHHKPWGLRDYRQWFDHPEGPLMGAPEMYTIEPLYQLARSQCLCWRMEVARELGVDRVVFAVIVPDGNADYRRHVPTPLPGDDLLRAFQNQLRAPERFVHSSLARLMDAFDEAQFPEIEGALSEVRARYVVGR